MPRVFRQGWLILLALMVSFLAHGAPQEPKKLRVVASFSIVGDLARQIAGEKINLDVLVGPNGDCHVYEAKPLDAKKVMQADLVLMNGLGFEGWLPRLLQATKATAKVVHVSDGVVPITIEDAQNDDLQPTHAHSLPVDPHAWHNIQFALIYGDNIKKALSDLDPANAAVYKQNWATLKAKLVALEESFILELENLAPECKQVVTLHDGFRYLGQAYGISFMAPLGTTTDAEPSAGDIVSIIRKAKENNIRTVFLENISNPRVMEQIAKESKALVGDTLYSDALSEEGEAASTFEAMMGHNFRVFVKSFKAACQGKMVILTDED